VRALIISRGYQHARHNQWLRVHLVVERHGLKQTERRFPHVGRRQHRLILIPAGAIVIVVICGDRRLASSQQRARADENENSKYGSVADAATPWTISWHVLILIIVIDGCLEVALHPIVAEIPLRERERYEEI